MERKVVITGMGIWSCLGKTLEDVRDSLYTGKSGIIFSQERKDAGFRSALCADVERPDLKPFIPRNLRHFMPEEAQYAYMATRSALENAKLDQDYMDRNGLNHQKMTSKQRELFKELYESGRPNTLDEHTRIAKEALKAGGASESMINDLVEESLSNLAKQGVTQPTRIPWYSK